MFTLIALGAAAVAIAGGVHYLLLGRRLYGTEREFLRTGVRTQGLIVEMRDRPLRGFGDDSMEPMPRYFPVLDYQLPDGRMVQSESFLGARPAPGKVGDVVPIVFDPDNPERVMVIKGLAQPGAVGAFNGVLGCGLIVFGFLVIGFWVLLKLVLNVPV